MNSRRGAARNPSKGKKFHPLQLFEFTSSNNSIEAMAQHDDKSSMLSAWGNSNPRSSYTHTLQDNSQLDVVHDNDWPSLHANPKSVDQGNRSSRVVPNAVVPKPTDQPVVLVGGESDDQETDCYYSDDDEIDDIDLESKSHQDCKRSKWFERFFDTLDRLTLDEINDTERKWHCAACKGGVGEIQWYNGLEALVSHCRNIASKKVKLHRLLATVLEEELNRRGTSVLPPGDMYGKWQGLDLNEDKEIVWPPMVMVLNTVYEKDVNDRWIGMGNQELLEYFSSYAALKARHSYGPQGHRGISVLIFEGTAVGYLEAERLSKHFEDSGRDREAWEHRRVLFYPGGKRQLYGYLATKKDMDIFNQHSSGKSRLKYEMKSYREMVVSQIWKMKEDSEQLICYKNKVVKEQMYSKAMEETQLLLSEKLGQALQVNEALRTRTKIHHEHNKEAMDYLDKFYSESLDQIYQERNKKEDEFEKLQKERLDKVKNYEENGFSEDQRQRKESIARFVELQDEEMKAYIAERERLLEIQKGEIVAMKHRHKQEEIAIEQEFTAKLDELMKKYTS